MIWIIIVFAIIAVCLDTLPGKIVFAATIMAIGLLLLSWITGIGFFVSVAKGCAAVIVVLLVGVLLIGIVG